jgi:exodeoxyribonuclease III
VGVCDDWPRGSAQTSMKLATFNINNINKRLHNLLAWLQAAEPDVICLQELKAATTDFPRAAVEAAGYGAVWRGQSSWNGVAILARGAEPVMTRNALPDDPDEKQPRYIEAAVNGVIVGCLYAPNGNPQPGPKFDYKLAWNERLIAHAAELFASGLPVVLAGDYNIVPTPFDIYETRSYDDNALVQPAAREQYARLLAQGWVDALRKKHPNEQVFTFWHYMRKRWERNAGLRLDHILLSKKMARRLIDAGVDREVRAEENASDHAPVWVALKD